MGQPSNILDLIDNAIADGDSVTGDAMRWVPDLPSEPTWEPTWEGVPLGYTTDGGMFFVETNNRTDPTDRVAMFTYQVERPDGTALYRWTVPSTYAIHGVAADRGGALRIGLDMIRPPWRLRHYKDGEWGTIAEVSAEDAAAVARHTRMTRIRRPWRLRLARMIRRPWRLRLARMTRFATGGHCGGSRQVMITDRYEITVRYLDVAGERWIAPLGTPDPDLAVEGGTLGWIRAGDRPMVCLTDGTAKMNAETL